jgi:hypothetical protein
MSEEMWKTVIFWVFDAPDVAEKPLEVTLPKMYFKIVGANGIFK